MRAGMSFDGNLGRGVYEMHSQNACPVPPGAVASLQSTAKSPLCPLSRWDSQGLEQFHDMPARVGRQDEEPPCQDWLLPTAHDTKKRTLPRGCRSG